jgi:hypothetical protein
MVPDDFQRESVESYLQRWTASYVQYGRGWTSEKREESRRAMIDRVKQMTKDWDAGSRRSVSIPADPLARRSRAI